MYAFPPFLARAARTRSGVNGAYGHAHADGVEDGVADGGGGRDRRRLADADDAALRHVHHVDDDLRHVVDAAELVELHVGIDLPAGVRGP